MYSLVGDQSMITDDEHVVLTKPAAASFRQMAGIDMDERTIRAIILKSLPTGKLVHSREDPKGLLRIIRTKVYSFERDCEIMLVWGKDEEGNPRLGPDGIKHTVFIVSFKSRSLTAPTQILFQVPPNPLRPDGATE